MSNQNIKKVSFYPLKQYRLISKVADEKNEDENDSIYNASLEIPDDDPLSATEEIEKPKRDALTESDYDEYYEEENNYGDEYE